MSFLVLNSNRLIVEVCEHPCFVRRQSNGVVVLSTEDKADAIYVNDSDTFWQLQETNYLNDVHTLVEVESVPAVVVPGYWYYQKGEDGADEFLTTEERLTALAKADAADIASLVFVSMVEEGKFDDTTILEHANQFPAWAPSMNCIEGSYYRGENGKLHRCLQSHTSQEGWEPENAPSLFKEVGDPTAEWPEWSQPVGAGDAYMMGAKSAHNGKHWVSDVDNNVWEPGVYGWSEVAE